MWTYTKAKNKILKYRFRGWTVKQLHLRTHIMTKYTVQWNRTNKTLEKKKCGWTKRLKTYCWNAFFLCHRCNIMSCCVERQLISYLQPSLLDMPSHSVCGKLMQTLWGYYQINCNAFHGNAFGDSSNKAFWSPLLKEA